MLNFRFSRSLPGMDGSGGVALHLSIDGRPVLTPVTTPSSSVIVYRHLVFLLVVVLFMGLIGLCLIPLICSSCFNLGSGGLEAVDEISNRSMMLSA
ncbi:unnamed protein product [Brassica oleracea]